MAVQVGSVPCVVHTELICYHLPPSLSVEPLLVCQRMSPTIIDCECLSSFALGHNDFES